MNGCQFSQERHHDADPDQREFYKTPVHLLRQCRPLVGGLSRSRRARVMFRPIELVRVLDSGTTKPFYVNPDHIVSFEGGWSEIGSYLTLSDGGTYSIRET